MYDLTQSTFFFDLLGYVYGVTTEEELTSILVSRPSQSVLKLGQLLKVFLAAVVSLWVLQEQHGIIVKDPTARNKSFFEKEVAKSITPDQ